MDPADLRALICDGLIGEAITRARLGGPAAAWEQIQGSLDALRVDDETRVAVYAALFPEHAGIVR